MIAMVTDKLVLGVYSYLCHNTLYLLVEKQSSSVPKNVAVKPLVLNVQQFQKCPFLDTV